MNSIKETKKRSSTAVSLAEQEDAGALVSSAMDYAIFFQHSRYNSFVSNENQQNSLLVEILSSRAE